MFAIVNKKNIYEYDCYDVETGDYDDPEFGLTFEELPKHSYQTGVTYAEYLQLNGKSA